MWVSVQKQMDLPSSHTLGGCIPRSHLVSWSQLSPRYTTSGFMISTSAKVLWCRNRNPKIVKIHVYTHKLDIPLVSCTKLPPKSSNHRDILVSGPHRYPTHILSNNHYHPRCICEDMGSQKSSKITFIHTDSRFHWLYALNFHQSLWFIEISRTQIHTGTPHIKCHTTTVI